MAKVVKRGDSWQLDYYDPNGKRVRMAFAKKKDAEAELAKRVSLIAEGRYLDVRKDFKTSLGDLIKKYEENFQDQRGFQTSKQYCVATIKKHFGEHTLLANIRYVDLESFRNTLRRQEIKRGKPKADNGAREVKRRSDASVNRIMACLGHMFSKAVEWEMMEKSPFGKGKNLTLKENNARLRFLSTDEIVKLMAALKEGPKYLERVVICALNTGMRKEEILSLKWDQIRGGFIYLTQTKSNKARQIPINATLESVFATIRRENQLRHKHVFTGKRHVYANWETREISETVEGRIKDIKTAWQTTLRRAGIKDCRFHDLRHTFASHMVMRGANLKDVQELLGHATLAMTLRYSHLSQEHKKAAVDRLSDLTTPASSAPSDTLSEAPQNATGHKVVTPSKKRLAATS